ncbi:DoxX family protein [Flavobacterium aquidurense]|nr:MauE/DoxX family redox-associated membrane protein [Flavobacterium aquidurense]
MRLIKKPKELFIEIVCLLYIFLFIYAAMSKGLDFENFKIQLGQSPLLSAFADWVSWLVLIVEFAIAILLIFRRTRIMALYAGFCLMTMFTAYIYIILNYSSFVPCSCGGILEKMNWKQHLAFNIAFVILGGAALWINHTKNNSERTQKTSPYYLQLFVTIVFSSTVVMLLFLYSEKIMHYENPFIRRYPQHPAQYKKELDLKYNSYYFAGQSAGRIYLGNYTAPLMLKSVDKDLDSIKIEKIIFNPEKKIPFQSTKISVRGSYFYLKDGKVPTVFRGSTRDWKLDHEIQGVPYFTLAQPMDSSSMAFRSNTKSMANILGVYNENQNPQVKFKSTLLQKQLDGFFDTDGVLLYDEGLQKQIYLYFYRNQYIIADKNGELIHRGRTIDTISKAKIKVAYLKKEKQNERTMKAPPLIVNANAAVYGNLLFVNSKIKGKFEDDKLWEQASIIDVYDINRHAYIMSLAIYNIGDDKLKDFLVTDDSLYALIGNQLVVYKFRDILKKEIKNESFNVKKLTF